MTDVIELVADLLPRPVQRLLAMVLCVALITGVATPLATWLIETKTREVQSDLQPILERMLTLPTTAATP